MTSAVAKLDKNFEIPNITTPLEWYDIANLPTEGQGWTGEAPGRFGRLPAKAEGVVRDAVWQLGKHSAGMAVRFVTDSVTIAASWDLVNEGLAMAHMPATGMSGLDLYIRSEGRWRWAAITRPEGKGAQTHTQLMVDGIKPGEHEYLLYLPLYNAVSGVRIGVQPGSVFKAAPARAQGQDKPICFYGTSILQGGCASRAGMAYPSIIGRYLDLPQINLGFSGNGIMEPEVADLLAELDPCMYVLDPLPNNEKQGIEERGEALVQKIRAAHPTTPIVMVENIVYQNGHILKLRHDRSTSSNDAWRVIFDKLVKQGDKNLYYIPGDQLLGDDDEATVDGTHGTDLGFYRMAKTITPYLKKIFQGNS